MSCTSQLGSFQLMAPAKPTLELNKKKVLTNGLLFYVFKPIELGDLSEGLYKKQRIKFFEEGTGLSVSI